MSDTAATPGRAVLVEPDRPPVQATTNYPALAVLAAAAFVYVSAETLPVGLLPEIARGLSVSEAQVGLLLTSYAAVAGLATIPLTAFTLKMARHRLIAGTVAVFVVSQALAAMAPTFGTLMVARLLCALAHGVFWSALAPVAARLAPPGQAGRATGLVFLGNSLALVVGVPLGTLIGQTFGWRTAIATLAVAGAVGLGALLVVVPAVPAQPQDLARRPLAALGSTLATVRAQAVATVCGITLVLVIGNFVAYTYLAPLARRSGLEGAGLSVLLLGFGAAGVLATLLTGRFVDRRPGPALAALIGLVAAALAVLALSPGQAPTVLAVLVWGAGMTALPVCLQAAVLRVAPDRADGASALYVVAFQIGIGGGALIGEQLVRAGLLDLLPVIGATTALVTCIGVLVARQTFPPRVGPRVISGAR